jgi:hypothetical protein
VLSPRPHHSWETKAHICCALVSLGRVANNMLREASIQPIVRLKGSHWSEMNLTRAKDLTPTGARLHSRIGQPFIDYSKHPKSLF